jgi:hypothetical protein
MKARTAVAVVTFVLGTMYLWSSPSFVKPSELKRGAPDFAEKIYTTGGSLNQAWQLLSVLAVLGFAVAAWGVYKGEGWWIFKGSEWWIPFAIGSAILGLAVLLPWWFAVGTTAPATTVAVNAILLLWDLALLVVLVAPQLRERVIDRL